jgi:ribose transport system ATP-binding protein
MESIPLLEMKGITKYFPGVLALNKVDFVLMRGEVHALVGENGAGKSTLMKILGGAFTADDGEIWFNGERITLHNPKDAIEKGINMVHQELMLAPHLSAAENILMGKYSMKRGLINWQNIRETSKKIVESLGVDIDVMKPVRSLSIAQQQIIEIARALQRKSQILILDEPSAVLGKHDIEILYSVIRQLKSQGISVVYISHRLEEIFVIADRVTILKDGVLVCTKLVSELDSGQLIQKMIGREITNLYKRSEQKLGEVALRVEKLSRGNKFEDISFEVRYGEILGIAGLVGSGRTEVMRVIAGADKPDHGTIYINNIAVRIRSPRQAMTHGIGMLPEDRTFQGLFSNRPLNENISISSLKDYLTFIYLNLAKERKTVQQYINQLKIRATNQNQLVYNLSGGNKQKAIIARWLAAKSKILIFDEPTRGVDIGAKMEIYRLLDELARSGVAILLVSSEITEILGMSDNILVMWRGRVSGYFSRAEATEEKVLQAALLGGNN